MSYFYVIQLIFHTSMDDRKSLEYIIKNILENRKTKNKKPKTSFETSYVFLFLIFIL